MSLQHIYSSFLAIHAALLERRKEGAEADAVARHIILAAVSRFTSSALQAEATATAVDDTIRLSLADGTANERTTWQSSQRRKTGATGVQSDGSGTLAATSDDKNNRGGARRRRIDDPSNEKNARSIRAQIATAQQLVSASQSLYALNDEYQAFLQQPMRNWGPAMFDRLHNEPVERIRIAAARIVRDHVGSVYPKGPSGAVRRAEAVAGPQSGSYVTHSSEEAAMIHIWRDPKEAARFHEAMQRVTSAKIEYALPAVHIPVCALVSTFGGLVSVVWLPPIAQDRNLATAEGGFRPIMEAYAAALNISATSADSLSPMLATSAGSSSFLMANQSVNGGSMMLAGSVLPENMNVVTCPPFLGLYAAADVRLYGVPLPSAVVTEKYNRPTPTATKGWFRQELVETLPGQKASPGTLSHITTVVAPSAASAVAQYLERRVANYDRSDKTSSAVQLEASVVLPGSVRGEPTGAAEGGRRSTAPLTASSEVIVETLLAERVVSHILHEHGVSCHHMYLVFSAKELKSSIPAVQMLLTQLLVNEMIHRAMLAAVRAMFSSASVPDSASVDVHHIQRIVQVNNLIEQFYRDPARVLEGFLMSIIRKKFIGIHSEYTFSASSVLVAVCVRMVAKRLDVEMDATGKAFARFGAPRTLSVSGPIMPIVWRKEFLSMPIHRALLGPFEAVEAMETAWRTVARVDPSRAVAVSPLRRAALAVRLLRWSHAAAQVQSYHGTMIRRSTVRTWFDALSDEADGLPSADGYHCSVRGVVHGILMELALNALDTNKHATIHLSDLIANTELSEDTVIALYTGEGAKPAALPILPNAAPVYDPQRGDAQLPPFAKRVQTVLIAERMRVAGILLGQNSDRTTKLLNAAKRALQRLFFLRAPHPGVGTVYFDLLAADLAHDARVATLPSILDSLASVELLMELCKFGADRDQRRLTTTGVLYDMAVRFVKPSLDEGSDDYEEGTAMFETAEEMQQREALMRLRSATTGRDADVLLDSFVHRMPAVALLHVHLPASIGAIVLDSGGGGGEITSSEAQGSRRGGVSLLDDDDTIQAMLVTRRQDPELARREGLATWLLQRALLWVLQHRCRGHYEDDVFVTMGILVTCLVASSFDRQSEDAADELIPHWVRFRRLLAESAADTSRERYVKTQILQQSEYVGWAFAKLVEAAMNSGQWQGMQTAMHLISHRLISEPQDSSARFALRSAYNRLRKANDVAFVLRRFARRLTAEELDPMKLVAPMEYLRREGIVHVALSRYRLFFEDFERQVRFIKFERVRLAEEMKWSLEGMLWGPFIIQWTDTLFAAEQSERAIVEAERYQEMESLLERCERLLRRHLLQTAWGLMGEAVDALRAGAFEEVLDIYRLATKEMLFSVEVNARFALWLMEQQARRESYFQAVARTMRRILHAEQLIEIEPALSVYFFGEQDRLRQALEEEHLTGLAELKFKERVFRVGLERAARMRRQVFASVAAAPHHSLPPGAAAAQTLAPARPPIDDSEKKKFVDPSPPLRPGAMNAALPPLAAGPTDHKPAGGAPLLNAKKGVVTSPTPQPPSAASPPTVKELRHLWNATKKRGA